MIKIMHVDDDSEVRDIVDLALCLAGDFVVLPCASGEEALDQVEAFGPDAFLIDLMMPGMDGRETMAALRELPGYAQTPVIFLTGQSSVADVSVVTGAGAADVIAKPFDPLVLADRIKAAVPAYA